MKRLLVILLTGLVMLGYAGPAWAHQVETFYTLGNQLEFQSLFSTGEPFVGAKVRVFAPNNSHQPWQTLTTDGEGRFSFLPDPSIPGNWEVAIESDDQSHADYWTVPVGEQGIIYDGISLDSTQDQHYRAAAVALGPWLMAVAAGLAWSLWRRR
ncbi:MAG TPA: carboxypeptidase regulatory-like domain-containing protein [Leptolyngbyaceae cyanobacterium M65_K2018_010]|nr:carboxypeptidase regulatory-like domain-containing protein [Leptolyngbyaceae cyanobacterium M65_K2018_010]